MLYNMFFICNTFLNSSRPKNVSSLFVPDRCTINVYFAPFQLD